jgi:uncharacterized protein (DUF1330 family)
LRGFFCIGSNTIKIIRSLSLIRSGRRTPEFIKLPHMIYVTQLIYIKEGQQHVFHQFEDVAIPIIKKYNGRLLLRLRPNEASVVEANTEKPYEVHLVEFATDNDFENFMRDEERKQFLHLKEQSIKTVVLIKGEKI